MGPFEAFYASPVQHPFLLWAAALLGCFVCLTRPGVDPRVKRYGLLLTALSLSDAWLTSNPVYGIGQWTGWAASIVPLFFVLAGDFRFLLLLGAATPRGGFEPSAGRIASALGLTVIVPIVSQLGVSLLPEAWAGPRVLFLIYELAFLLLTLVLMRWHPSFGRSPWLKTVSRFVLVYYGLWASADVILLATGSDLGFLLRVVPNLLYYGGLIGAIGWAAPRAGSLSVLNIRPEGL